MREKFRSKLLWVVNVLILVGALYFGIKGVMVLALHTSSPMMSVASGSMEPTFGRGTLIIVQGYDDVSQVKENDIIVFERSSGRRIVHRVSRIMYEGSQVVGFRTMGDAYSKEDDWIVRWEDIKGKVVFWIPYLGYPSLGA